MLPDMKPLSGGSIIVILSQCTYRCVVLPDTWAMMATNKEAMCLNAPTGAWCSLTFVIGVYELLSMLSQCTYRCVVLPDMSWDILKTWG